jgi:hypothetical protein
MAGSSEKDQAPSAPEPPVARPEEAGDAGAPLLCDFCGQPAPVVRRVALDRGYERLQTLHAVRYACPRCSDEKEQRRLGLRRG